MLSVNIGDYGSWLVDALTKCLYAWINLVCPLPERYRMPPLLGCPRPSSKWQLGRTPWYQRTDILYVIRSQNTTLMSGWVNYVCICTVRVQFIKFNIASGHATSGHGHATCFWTARYCKKQRLRSTMCAVSTTEMAHWKYIFKRKYTTWARGFRLKAHTISHPGRYSL